MIKQQRNILYSPQKPNNIVTLDSQADDGGHVRGGGHLALVLASVQHAHVPDGQHPVPGGGLVVRLQPQVGGVGVAAHRQQGRVRQPDPAHLEH